MWCEEDYMDYFDYSEFDAQIEEFKDSLRNSVKQEIMDKIKSLEEELDKYRNIKENYEAKMTEMNNIDKQLKEKAYTDIFKGDKIDAWGIQYRYDYIKPQCDKCDDKRRIHFKSPSGVDHSESCSCSKTRCIYDIVPAEVSYITSKLRRFRSESSPKDTLYFSYEVKKSYGEQDEDHILERVSVKNIDDFDLTKPNNYIDYSWQATQHGVVFLNKEDAQKVCDWLNERSLEESQKVRGD